MHISQRIKQTVKQNAPLHVFEGFSSLLNQILGSRFEDDLIYGIKENYVCSRDR